MPLEITYQQLQSKSNGNGFKIGREEPLSFLTFCDPSNDVKKGVFDFKKHLKLEKKRKQPDKWQFVATFKFSIGRLISLNTLLLSLALGKQ